ncbi:MAG: CopD family protein [Betaproteobacteria bacterium]
MDDATLAALRIAASASVDIGFATTVGALATAGLLRDASSAWGAARSRRAQGLAVVACIAALAASLAWLWVEAIAMTELAPGAALLAAGSLVTETQFGRAWAVGAAALVACAACVGVALRVAPRRGVGVAAGLALAVFAGAHASAGHAGANGFGPSTVVMTVHLLAIGLWAGAVIAAALVVVAGAGVDATDGVRYASRLSSLATAALALVAATGVLAAWHGLGASLAPLAPASGSAWGQALDAKLGGVALAIGLGGFNRLVGLPALKSGRAFDGPWRGFARVLRIEAMAMIAVLVAAALLGNGEPPAV